MLVVAAALAVTSWHWGAALVLLIAASLVGAIAHADSATGAMVTCAVVVLACALAAVLAPPIRRIGPPVAQLAPASARKL
jgi:hypothetical protein